MTDRRRRERTLPAGYQFGDASRAFRRGDVIEFDGRGDPVTHWNVIEGEQFGVDLAHPSDAERHPVIEGAR